MSPTLQLYHQHQRILQNCFSLKCLQFSSIVFNIRQKQQYCTLPPKENPLVDLKGLPDFQKVTGDSINEALPYLLSLAETQYTEFEQNLEKNKDPSWDDVIPKSEKIFDNITLAWNAVQHLYGVKNNPALRDAYQKVQPNLVSLGNKVSQSKSVYAALQNLQSNNDNLDEAQGRIIESSLQSARLSGVHLEGSKQDEFNKIAQELADLGTKFQNNVLDSTKGFSFMIKSEADLEGLPASAKSLMALYAGQEMNETIDENKGPWKLSLDMPCFEPFMKYSMNSPLREMLYKSYITRASTDETDNSNIIENIRKLRKRKSKILGFDNFAELSTSRKMAKTPDAVWNMIRDLADKAKPVAQLELSTLRQFASSNGFNGDLKHWDLAYWSERQKEHLLSLNEEKLREYFPLPRVLDGLFSLSQEIFGIQIKEEKFPAAELWNEDVKFFKIFNEQGKHMASFFLDLYSRPAEKQGGAWMGHALDRNDAYDRKPIAYLVCNQSPPVGETPSLMTFREVTTLFHEVSDIFIFTSGHMFLVS